MSDSVQDLLFYGFYFGYLLLLVIIFRMIKFRVSDLRPLNILVLFFVAFSYIGILPLYLGSSPYFVNVGVTDKSLVLQMLVFSIISISCFLITGAYFEAKLRYNGDYTRKQLVKLAAKEKAALLLSLGFVILVIIDYVSKVDTLAILVLLSPDVGDVGMARSSMGNNFSGGYHWYSVIMHDVLFIITISLFVNYLISKRRMDALLFTGVFLLNSFSLVMATEKAPIMWLLVSLILSYMVVRKHSKLQTKILVISFLSISVVLTILMSLFMGLENLGDAYASVIRRAFAGSVAPAYFYLDYIPLHQDFLYGRSFPNPAGILPFEHFRLTVEIMNWRFPELATKGIVGSSPTVYWAEAYANFGSIGVFVTAIIMATYISIILKLVSKLRYTPVSLAFVIWLIMHFKDLSQSGFSGYFFDMKLVLVFLFVVSINYLVPNFVPRKQNI